MAFKLKLRTAQDARDGTTYMRSQGIQGAARNNNGGSYLSPNVKAKSSAFDKMKSDMNQFSVKKLQTQGQHQLGSKGR